MSDPVSALGQARFDGVVKVAEIGPLGMIALRCEAGTAAQLAPAGITLPGLRRIVADGDTAIGWMSPDEWLLIRPYAQVADTLAAIGSALAGTHHLAVDVSDARAVFTVSGADADAVLARLCPVDFARLPAGELRRSRMAQVACALWRSGPDQVTVVTFRSVARYAFDLLVNAAH